VLTALIADIHANKQAFTACLERVRELGADRIVLLGDYVGYGADPEWSVRTVMRLVDESALALIGNHDHAVSDTRDHMTLNAQIAIEWTRCQIGAPERQFLAGLPLTVRDGERLYVHADASAPQLWNYVTSPQDAYRSLAATDARVVICGHVHQPALYCLSAVGKMTAFRPVTGVPVPLLARHRWHVVLGSAGQPRDGNPAASFAMLDTNHQEITFCRAAYDVEAAAAAIRDNGLPLALAERLTVGR
jgi:diadenosine tetraphosphatase ApaH/serine/threonine PP2A family protein phosphatase